MDIPDHTTTELAGPPLAMFGMEGEQIPEQFGSYRILGILARSMALVYKAEQQTPKRVVALKIPRGGQLIAPESRQRFLREVQLAAETSHAGIVPVLDAGEVDGVPYYTMPFIEGLPLDQHIERDNPDLSARLQLFRRLCAVVHTLHERNLVHRDLKPGNILVDRNGDIRLLDFGLAKALDESDDLLSRDYTTMGTLQYMAPEQTQSGANHHISPAADVYALGMIAYQMLSGELPYCVQRQTEAATLHLIRESRPMPLSTRQPALSREMGGVVMRCLEKDAGKRPATAGILLEMIDAALSGQPGQISKRGPRIALALGLFLFFAVAAWSMLLFWSKDDGHADRASIDHAIVQDEDFITTDQPGWRIEVVDPDLLATSGMSTSPPDHEMALPTRLWPVYEQLASKLRSDFALRNHGALLFEATTGGTLRISGAGDQAATVHVLRAGQTAILTAPRGLQTHILWQSEASERQQKIPISDHQITYVKLTNGPDLIP